MKMKFITIALMTLFCTSQVYAQKGKWISLFDGKTTKGWHSYGKEVAGAAWKVEDGAITLDPSQKNDWQVRDGGDLVSADSFDDFHLQLEWKIAKNGNSGIIFFIQDDAVKYKNTWYTGPEMQVLDNDGHGDGKIFKHRAGNLYDLVAGKEGVVKAVGEWNKVDIIAEKGKLTFKLNDTEVLSTTYGDDNWKELIKNSKFSKGESPDFGKVFSGHIGLQDHGDRVYYRNIRIQRL
ncbi:MAG: DUF1080 domain-containing protein [Chitinophagia bacterium]|jgi:hypothetical protein|nr:DUF1080 domain-containing protein [Chitinophagia bacterium]